MGEVEAAGKHFTAENEIVYARTDAGPVAIARAASSSWAETIADALNNDLDAYPV